MQRREFLKIAPTVGAGSILLNGCGAPEKLIPLLVSPDEFVPYEEGWVHSVCQTCSAGCGILVRVMQGESVRMVNGQEKRVKSVMAKKIEGDPAHPISMGGTCARGQASVQALYHPDRIQGPLKLTGPRGSGQYQSISWKDAMQLLTGQLQQQQAAPQAVAILRLELVPELERFVAGRKLHGASDGATAHAGRGVAVDLRGHAVHGLLVRALIDPVPQILRGPDDIAFDVDRRCGRPSTQPVTIRGLELVAEVERLVAGRKRHHDIAAARGDAATPAAKQRLRARDVVGRQVIGIADVAVHDCHNRLAMIVGMTKANEMAELVERDAPKVIYRDATSPTSHVPSVRIPIHRAIEDHVGFDQHVVGCRVQRQGDGEHTVAERVAIHIVAPDHVVGVARHAAGGQRVAYRLK
jgi:hypothetical protein